MWLLFKNEERQVKRKITHGRNDLAFSIVGLIQILKEIIDHTLKLVTITPETALAVCGALGKCHVERRAVSVGYNLIIYRMGNLWHKCSISAHYLAICYLTDIIS